MKLSTENVDTSSAHLAEPHSDADTEARGKVTRHVTTEVVDVQRICHALVATNSSWR